LAAAFEGFIAIDSVIVFGLAFLTFLPSFFVVRVESLPAAVDSIVEIAEPETITTSPDAEYERAQILERTRRGKRQRHTRARSAC